MAFIVSEFNWHLLVEEAIALRDKLNAAYPPDEDEPEWTAKEGRNGWMVLHQTGQCAGMYIPNEPMAKRIAEMLNSREELA